MAKPVADRRGPLHKGLMKKVDDYQGYAKECRDLAARMDDPDVRAQLLEMAQIWEDLAAEREAFVSEHPAFAIPLVPEG